MAKKYNCVKNGIPYFRKTKTIGHDINGNPIKKEFYGDGEKDADRLIAEYMKDVENGLNMDASKLTVEQGMHQWLFDVLLLSRTKKSASFDKHECNFRNYVKSSEIGCIPIKNAISLPFQRYYNKLYKEGIDIIDLNTNNTKHINVSSDKIFDLNKTLRAFFTYCINQNYTTKNPCSMKNIEIPGNADGEEDEADEEGNNIQVFNDKEMKIIKENIKCDPFKDNTFNVMVQLDFITGLRLGELTGLKKKYVSNYMVKVRNTLKRVKIYDSPTSYHRELKLIKPKSKTSIRNVNYAKYFCSTLEDYFKTQEIKWKNNGLEFNDDSLIFTTDSCSPIDAANFHRAWRRFLKRINVDFRKPHSMRDTYATTLFKRGAKLHDVKELLGHSSITITEKYYLFVFPEDKVDTANLMDNFI